MDTFASGPAVNGGAEPDSPPTPTPSTPAAPGTEPIPSGPSGPFPGEPGDMPAAEPVPEHERSVPRQNPDDGREPIEKAAAATGDPALEKVIASVTRDVRSKYRFAVACIAQIQGVSTQLNYLHSACSRLDIEDWREFPDIAPMLQRPAQDLANLLAPVCAQLDAAKRLRLTALN
jgi:hypothetical protein